MKRSAAVAAMVTIGMLMSGCEALRPSQSQPPQAPKPDVAKPVEPPVAAKVEPTKPVSEVESMLAYFDYIRRLPPAELGREHDSARQAFAGNRSDAARLRLALLLSLPNAPFKEEAKALELLEPMVKDTRSQYTPLRGFAFLLAVLVSEQRKLGSSVQGLQEKLEALKSLERSLNERERGDTQRRR